MFDIEHKNRVARKNRFSGVSSGDPAIDAIGQRGTFTIEISAALLWKDRRISDVRVSIGDTGVGIRPEHHENFF